MKDENKINKKMQKRGLKTPFFWYKIVKVYKDRPKTKIRRKFLCQ